jgi:hypothetical protein
MTPLIIMIMATTMTTALKTKKPPMSWKLTLLMAVSIRMGRIMQLPMAPTSINLPANSLQVSNSHLELSA